MIRDNDLKRCEGLGWFFTDEAAETMDLSLVKKLLKEQNEKSFGLPIKFGWDEVRHGGLLNATKEPCLLIANKEHVEDYFRYCITLHKQGRRLNMQCYYCGQSTLTGKKHAEEEREKSIGGMILNMLTRVDQTKVDEEYTYYNELDNLIKETFA